MEKSEDFVKKNLPKSALSGSKKNIPTGQKRKTGCAGHKVTGVYDRPANRKPGRQ